jgi:hypothetical protein
MNKFMFVVMFVVMCGLSYGADKELNFVGLKEGMSLEQIKKKCDKIELHDEEEPKTYIAKVKNAPKVVSLTAMVVEKNKGLMKIVVFSGTKNGSVKDAILYYIEILKILRKKYGNENRSSDDDIGEMSLRSLAESEHSLWHGWVVDKHYLELSLTVNSDGSYQWQVAYEFVSWDKFSTAKEKKEKESMSKSF